MFSPQPKITNHDTKTTTNSTTIITTGIKPNNINIDSNEITKNSGLKLNISNKTNFKSTSNNIINPVLKSDPMFHPISTSMDPSYIEKAVNLLATISSPNKQFNQRGQTPTTSSTSNSMNVSTNNGNNGLCNCRKSKCLKLYCDCFRLQKFCDGCHCNDCENRVSE